MHARCGGLPAKGEAAVQRITDRHCDRRADLVDGNPAANSADNDVTPASVMPQGTMALNASRWQSQLSANPCSVVARDTRTPMAATLRSGWPALPGTHTPERPSTRVVFRPHLRTP